MTCHHTVDTTSQAYCPDGSLACAACARKAWAAHIAGRPLPETNHIRPAKEAS